MKDNYFNDGTLNEEPTIKKYTKRDKFINDDGLTDEEKAEIMQDILEAEEEQEHER